MPVELGEEALRRFTADACLTMRDAVGEAGGREVFFSGSLDARGLIERVRVVARGNAGAVPAVFEGLRTREVVIHNHPSGNLEPSDADLSLASAFANNGHGVYIIDNQAERVFVVVEPFLECAVTRLEPDTLAKHFAPGGALAEALHPYEERPQQTEMMAAAARAFNHDGIAAIEAPTGVGKSLAYLVPAAAWAQANRERVVISTHTINLQEQLVEKDIPLAGRCCEKPPSAVLVKGRQNYLCLRKLQRAASEAALFDDSGDAKIIKQIAEWAAKTADGSLSDLPFVPQRNLWERLCSESDTCHASNCPNAGKCFIGRARRDIAKADILVVNHHMLFSDLSIKQQIGQFGALAVLPGYSRVIIDEAHTIEDTATAYFGVEATRNGSLALLGRFLRAERGRDRGLVPYLKLALQKESGWLPPGQLGDLLDTLDNELLPALAAVREALTAAFGALRSWTAEQVRGPGRDIKLRLTRDLLQDEALRDIHKVYLMPAVEDLRTLAKLCANVQARLRKLPNPPEEKEAPFLTELLQFESYRNRLDRLSLVLQECASPELAKNTVRWIEIDSSNANIVRVARAPLDVGEPLADWVYGNLKTAVLTSATLTVDQQFDYFSQRTGLDRVEPQRMETAVLDSPFNFEEQAVLALPRDVQPPDAPGFAGACAAEVEAILEITRGHALVLFTSYYTLDQVHRTLKPVLAAQGIAALKQGEANRSQLLARFRADASSVLFATDSFWQGVDVAGNSLQCVIVTRLPFRVPTEPIQQARVEAIEQAGGSAFMEYTVPQAVIKFRQGFGRLIRRKTDRGAVVVLDPRIVSKPYGRVFQRSLPGVRVVTGPRDGVYSALRQFFNGTAGNAAPGI